MGAPDDPGAARHAQASRGALAARLRTAASSGDSRACRDRASAIHRSEFVSAGHELMSCRSGGWPRTRRRSRPRPGSAREAEARPPPPSAYILDRGVWPTTGANRSGRSMTEAPALSARILSIAWSPLRSPGAHRCENKRNRPGCPPGRDRVPRAKRSRRLAPAHDSSPSKAITPGIALAQLRLGESGRAEIRRDCLLTASGWILCKHSAVLAGPPPRSERRTSSLLKSSGSGSLAFAISNCGTIARAEQSDPGSCSRRGGSLHRDDRRVPALPVVGRRALGGIRSCQRVAVRQLDDSVSRDSGSHNDRSQVQVAIAHGPARSGYAVDVDAGLGRVEQAVAVEDAGCLDSTTRWCCSLLAMNSLAAFSS